MLTADELAGMAATQNAAMPDTAVVRYEGLTPDGQGGYTVAAGDIVCTVACRIAPARSQRAMLLAERLDVLTLWVITLPISFDGGTSYPERGYITVTNAQTGASREFRMIESPVLGAGWETARRVLCEELLT